MAYPTQLMLSETDADISHKPASYAKKGSTHLAHGRQDYTGEEVRKTAYDLCNLPHAVRVGNR